MQVNEEMMERHLLEQRYNIKVGQEIIGKMKILRAMNGKRDKEEIIPPRRHLQKPRS